MQSSHVRLFTLQQRFSHTNNAFSNQILQGSDFETFPSLNIIQTFSFLYAYIVGALYYYFGEKKIRIRKVFMHKCTSIKKIFAEKYSKHFRAQMKSNEI